MYNTPKQCKEIHQELKRMFDAHLERYRNPKYKYDFEGWEDLFWQSPYIKKCHLKVIDRLHDHNLWLMHLNIFPKQGYDLPILGFDIVGGPTKMSGGFFDFSPIINRNHPMVKHFAEKTAEVSWKRERPLPDWASTIFSKHMIAAGALKGEELEQMKNVVLDLVKWYLVNMEQYAKPVRIDTVQFVNNYCINQKKNEKLHSSLLKLGLSEESKNSYIDNILFEENMR